MNQFDQLIAKLSDLFELDKVDLDFGLHRIIKPKHQQITDYLTKRLPEKVKQVLGEIAQAEAAGNLAELKQSIRDNLAADAIADDGTLDEQYASTKLGKQYLDALKASTDAKAAEQTEAEVYSHLYEFFSRYYEDGDFISRRRRTAGKETYAIPYDGQEVVLHWANKDQYYIKSSEDLKDYTFTVPVDVSGTKGRVQFKLTRMDAVQNNNKANRIFVLDEEAEIEATEDTLVVPFHFAEGKKRTKAEEAEWEQSVLDALPKEWQARLSEPDTTYTGDDGRTILQKHLRNYTKKNTSDYFIHKDLGGFLRRELDFYIKNEVMYLDDVDRRPADYLEKELRKIKAIRQVAHDLIDFLAQFENFQKKLWLKKKFVIKTHWCITLDRVPEDLYPEIAANDAQRQEWVKLFAIDEIKADKLGSVAYSEPLTVEFLKANDKLLIDTAFFPSDFKYRLLGSMSGGEDIDSHTDGLLVHSENFQAINLLHERYQGQVQCTYIDPPYNTDAGPICYKNGYRSSSWASLMMDRIVASKHLLKPTGIYCATIDDYQQRELSFILEQVFGTDCMAGTVAVRINPSGRPVPSGFGQSHEYAIFVKASVEARIGSLPRSEKQKDRYKESDELGSYQWELFRKRGSNNERTARPSLHYPIYVKGSRVRVPEMTWQPAKKVWNIKEQPREDEIEVLPTDIGPDGKPIEKTWRATPDSIRENPDHFKAKSSGNVVTVYYKFRPKGDSVLPLTVWHDAKYSATEHGTGTLKKLFPDYNVFTYPKSIYAVEDSLRVAGMANSSGLCLDFFSGSGTTAHAIVNLNREDDGDRRYCLVEMGEYFESVTKPRVQKVVYSPDWKNGKPTTRDTGISHCFKYLRLESYEDALNNLELEDRSPDLLGMPENVAEEYLLRYALDIETRASLLNLERFEDPFNCTLRIYNRQTGEAEPTAIDLPETFNYLLGLRVRTMQMRDGFLVIEGENPAAETVLVIWRNVKEKDNKALKKFVTGTSGGLRINPADTEYAAIYINGDTTLDDPHKKVLLTEQAFHDLMFDVRGL